MLLEVLLLIAVVYVYSLYRKSKTTQNVATQVDDYESSRPIHAETQTANLELPLSLDATTQTECEKLQPVSMLPQPQISTATLRRPKIQATITEKSAKIDVMPPWFDPIPTPKLEQIRLPPTYDLTSTVDRQQINSVATYRCMSKGKSLDFVKDPFLGRAENTETLVVVLNQVVQRLGIELSFTNSQFSFDDSAYRTACGIVDLGNIHSLFTAENDIQTAKFQFNFNEKLNYKEISQTLATLRDFILRFITAIAKIINCKPEYIRVFGISNNGLQRQNLSIDFGITTQSDTKTKHLARQLQMAAASDAFEKQSDSSILQYVICDRYEIKWESTIKFLQLQVSDLEPKYNMDYNPKNHTTETSRGSHPYYLPIGWFRHALKVQDKYPQDKFWLGWKNAPGEWLVAYHGTRRDAVKIISQDGFSQSMVVRDICKKDAVAMVGSIADVPGIYLATHCEGGAAEYATTFPVKNDDGKTFVYKIVFQCRVEPDKYTEHDNRNIIRVGKALRVFDEKAVRPYGLLLKEEAPTGQSEDSRCIIA